MLIPSLPVRWLKSSFHFYPFEKSDCKATIFLNISKVHSIISRGAQLDEWSSIWWFD
jgi:hypothetical protein